MKTPFVVVFFGCCGFFSKMIVDSAGVIEDGTFLVFTDSLKTGIYCASNNSEKTYYVSLRRISNPVAVHYNEVTQKLYWSDVSLKEIRRISVDKDDDMLILALDINSKPDGLAVDETYNLLFYSDAGNHLIAVLDLDGLSRVDVITTHCDKPRAIVVDSDNGIMYWTDWGKVPKIESANYDGTNRKEIIKARLLMPNALYIDFSDKWIYWGDAGTHNIERAKLDGAKRQVIFYEPNAHYFSLIVHAGVIFYTDWEHRSVRSVKIDGKDNRVFGKEKYGRLNDLTRLKRKPENPRKNVCANRKESCSHICLPKPNGKRICLCPAGYALQNETFCIPACRALPTMSHTASPSECTTNIIRAGTICNLKCNDGFVGGNITLQCDQNGQWNNIIQECRDVQAPVIHNCPATDQILLPEKGNITLNMTWPDIIATDNSGIKPNVTEFVRSGTYFHEGIHTVTIMAVDHKGLFSICQFTFLVKVIRCGSVPVPENSYITSTWCQDYYGAVCYISCHPGYRFRNNSNMAKIECGLDKNNKAEWKSDEMSCEPISCRPINTASVVVTGCYSPFTVGTLCEQECADGYEKVHGTNTRVCKSDGDWSGQEMLCKKQTILCPDLFQMPSVLVSGCKSPYVIGSVCEQDCVAGYSKIQGSGARVCKSDGTWSGQDLLCNVYIAEQNTNNVLAIFIAAAAVIVSMLLTTRAVLTNLSKTSTAAAKNRLTESISLGSDEGDNRQ